MRGNDDCCNLTGRCVGKETVSKRRMDGIQHDKISKANWRGRRAEKACWRQVVVCFLGESAIVVPARAGQGLSFARVTYSCLSAFGSADDDDDGHAQHPCQSSTCLCSYYRYYTHFAVLHHLMYALSTDILPVYKRQETEIWKRDVPQGRCQAIRCDDKSNAVAVAVCQLTSREEMA